MRIFEGKDSTSQFYEDLLTSVKISGGEIAFVVKSQESLMQSIGIIDRSRLERMDQLSRFAKIKCLLWESDTCSLFLPQCEIRATERAPFSPLFCFLYAEKTAIVSRKGGEFFFNVFNSVEMSRKSWDYFLLAWKTGFPISNGLESLPQPR